MGNALKGWLGVALMVGWPLIPVALVQYGRHQGWQQHQSCLQESLSRDPEPEPAGSHSLLRQAAGLPPAGGNHRRRVCPGAAGQVPDAALIGADAAGSAASFRL